MNLRIAAMAGQKNKTPRQGLGRGFVLGCQVALIGAASICCAICG